jgi:hypothetical protein
MYQEKSGNPGQRIPARAEFEKAESSARKYFSV